MDTSDADGCSSFTVRVQDLTSHALMVDLSLRLAREIEPPRRRTAEHRRYGFDGGANDVQKVEVEFPSSRVVTIARRLVLPRLGVTRVPFEADLGSGLESFTLSLKVLPN
jgi:hypothetical protein